MTNSYLIKVLGVPSGKQRGTFATKYFLFANFLWRIAIELKNILAFGRARRRARGRVRGARQITGREFGKARPRAQPRLGLDRLAERKQVARRRHHAVELHRRRRGIARGEFRAGGDADALLHRREAIAVLGIENRPAERRIALRRKWRW